MGAEAAVTESLGLPRSLSARYEVGAITGDTAVFLTPLCQMWYISKQHNKGNICNLDPFSYSLQYKIQVQLKFQILVTSHTFLSKVTICYLQVVYLILYIFFT